MSRSRSFHTKKRNEWRQSSVLYTTNIFQYFAVCGVCFGSASLASESLTSPPSALCNRMDGKQVWRKQVRRPPSAQPTLRGKRRRKLAWRLTIRMALSLLWNDSSCVIVGWEKALRAKERRSGWRMDGQQDPHVEERKKESDGEGHERHTAAAPPPRGQRPGRPRHGSSKEENEGMQADGWLRFPGVDGGPAR